jgi:glycosyltransferase involved in cell wall biosynthesis
MSPEQIGFIFGSGWIGLKLSSLCIESVGRSIYDIRHIKTRRQQLGARTKRPKHLLLSVVVQADGQEEALLRCLESVAKQNYPKCEVIVVDNHSSREITSLVNTFKKKHAKLHIRVLPATPTKIQAKTSMRGDVVVYIDAKEYLENGALARINAYFLHDRARVIIPASKIATHKSMIGLVQEYESLRIANDYTLGLLSDKARTVRSRQTGNKETQNYYADDIVLVKQPTPTYRRVLLESVHRHEQNIDAAYSMSGFKRTIALLTGLSALLEPFAIAYFVYLGIEFDRPEPLALAWALGVFNLIFYVWSDKRSSLLGKSRLILLAPVGYVETLVLSLTRTVGMFTYVGKWLKLDWSSWQPALIAAD